MSSLQSRNIHLLWRSGFGPKTGEKGDLTKINSQALLKEIIEDSKEIPDTLAVQSDVVKELFGQKTADGKPLKLTKEEQGQFRKQSAADLKTLTLQWMGQMVNGKDQLREKMSLFWNNHFACRLNHIVFQQQLLDVIRQNALGNFGELLHLVSKTPAILNFLNNQQNKKGHPNENFAREVMELFTMGRNNYTEQDIRESARAYTGWGYNDIGNFVFRRKQHDNGIKTFLGKSGNFDGDDILDIILAQKATADFITRKIYRYLVNTQPDEAHLKELSKKFYESNYHIGTLIELMFSSSSFYEDKNIGVQIKSPVELAVGIQRMLPMEIANQKSLLLILQSLGQELFFPPNVAGWPGGRSWIDSSSLLLRMRLPQIMATNKQVNLIFQDDDDRTMGQDNNSGVPRKFKIRSKIDWDLVYNEFQKYGINEIPEVVASYLFLNRDRIDKRIMNSHAGNGSKEDYLKSIMIELMSTPEYQLC